MGATVLVVEDEAAIRELIALHLESAGHRAVCVADADAALGVVREALPDVALIDWMLPGQSGVALARALRRDARSRAMPIILLTARASEADKVQGLEAGADDYVTKPFSPRELIARIKAVLRRRAPHATDDPVEAGGLRLEPDTRRVFGDGRVVPLGPTEFRLLHYLMTHPERVHTRSQLLDQVWGDHIHLEERTVDVHIRRLRKALEQSGSDRLIETARGAGYRFSAHPA